MCIFAACKSGASLNPQVVDVITLLQGTFSRLDCGANLRAALFDCEKEEI